ncbi:unnamed protein product, partial [Ectocarpus sp. 8 AP-2014]
PTAASTRNDVGIDIPAATTRWTCVLCKIVWSWDTCY